MSFASDLITPIGATIRTAASSPLAWLISLVYGAIHSGGASAVLAGADEAIVSMATSASAFALLFVSLWLARSLGGPDLRPVRFWPWAGTTLVIVVISAAYQVISAMLAHNNASIGSLTSETWFWEPLVLVVLIFPLMLWSTALGLGKSVSFRASTTLEGVSFTRTWLAFFVTLLATSLIVNGIFQLVPDEVWESDLTAFLAATASSAPQVLLMTAFLVVAAHRISGSPSITAVFD